MKNALSISHEIISKHLKEGDTAVDATAGNGNDTLLMAKLVGNTGIVYAFDIQDNAIERTRKILNENELEHRVELIKSGHQYMDKYVINEISAVMFNLGYLPGGDHKIATKPGNTITALKTSLKLLKIGGIITIVVYYGGDSGFVEKDAVLKYAKQLDYKKYAVLMMDFINWINCPPILLYIRKLK
ncbi:MAG: methyltransferase domain-containing protein [Firmicutes bacterium]|nr:methyltransferase domain-containing protein [Bacillota bacterium]